jgi:MFS family permease
MTIHPDSPSTTPWRRVTTSRSGRFWLVAVLLGLLMFAASAPSPLYGVYAAKWHFSSTTLTAIFSVYAVALLVALLVAGRLSDHIGRRPVIAAGLVLEAGSMACFIAAHSVVLLYVARVLQGLATGAITGALSAALVDLQPSSNSTLAGLVNSATPGIGLAAGALATSALVQYGPAPTHLVYWLLLGTFVVGLFAVIAMAEPGARRPGALASLRPKLGVPRQARTAFASTLPCLVALWALGGFYLSLGPTLARELLASPNLLWGGLVIFLVTGVGAAAAIVWRSITPAAAMLAGCLGLVAGLGISIGAIGATSAPGFLVGSGVSGFGFGLAFLGAFRTLSALAPADERAGLIATIYTVSYLAFGVPVVIAGVAASHTGLHDTALAYGAALLVLVSLATMSILLRLAAHTHLRRRTPAHVNLPPLACSVPHCLHEAAIPASAE